MAKTQKRNQHTCKPLKWDEEFTPFLDQLSILIHEAEGKRKIRLARYQSIIAIGGYLGLKPTDLLGSLWSDFIDKGLKDVYNYNTQNNLRLYYPKRLLKLISSNYQIVKPPASTQIIMLAPNQTSKSISLIAFNKALKKLLQHSGIDTKSPSSEILRKTFGLRLFRILGSDEHALYVTSEILNNSSVTYTK